MARMIKVTVPDRREPFSLPDTLSDEEIRQVVVGQGYSACENADLVTDAQGNKRFQRVTGGAKATN